MQTNYITNMSPDILAESAPDLHDALEAANKANQREQAKQVAKLHMPDHIVTAARMNYLAGHGTAWQVKAGDGLFVRRLDSYAGGIYGGGLLLSDAIAAEVINCHCYLQVGVLLPGEELDEDGNVRANEGAPTRQENERITKSKDYAVDSKLRQSRAYADKFDRMTDNPQEKREFLKAAKEILQHRSGQNGEDLYLYNRSTGQWTKSTSGRDAGTPDYTQGIRSAISKAKQGDLVAFHNHPASMPPSDGDLNAARQNGYSVGYVLCHDGKIYRYTPPKREINRAFFDLRVADYKRNPYNYSEEQVQRKALTEMQEEFGFLFQEVT